MASGAPTSPSSSGRSGHSGRPSSNYIHVTTVTVVFYDDNGVKVRFFIIVLSVVPRQAICTI